MRIVKYLMVSLLIFSADACSRISILPEDGTAQTPLAATEQVESGDTVMQTGVAETETPGGEVLLEEVAVTPLKLPQRLEAASFEYSGMGWFGDNLVLLPQFPEGKDFSRQPNLISIAKEDLITAIGDPEFELPARDVPIINSDLRAVIQGFEGFESILFVDQTVYLTVESRAGNPMMGYLIRGEVQGELESITLDPQSLTELKPFSSERNATLEAMTTWNGNLYVIYEHNSGQGERQPAAYQFNQNLVFVQEIPFPEINFRVTDATISDQDGRFWVMNYFFPGDTHLAVNQDALVLEYGEGETHTNNEPVERMVQLQIGDNGITRIDQIPIYLQLLDDNIARNWEGIALLDDLGFLLITDSFPGSLLGFCPILR